MKGVFSIKVFEVSRYIRYITLNKGIPQDFTVLKLKVHALTSRILFPSSPGYY